jgi:hypothetical protein
MLGQNNPIHTSTSGCLEDEDKDRRFTQNIGTHLQTYMASHPREQYLPVVPTLGKNIAINTTTSGYLEDGNCRFSETLVIIYQPTWSHIPEDSTSQWFLPYGKIISSTSHQDILKIETAGSSKILVPIYQPTRNHIAEDGTCQLFVPWSKIKPSTMTTSGYLENGGRRFIRNTGTHLPTYVE